MQAENPNSLYEENIKKYNNIMKTIGEINQRLTELEKENK